MGRLAEVADDGHRGVGGAPGDHPALHRRQVLRLVEDDVQVDVLDGLLGLGDRQGLVQHRHVALLAVRVEAVDPAHHLVAFAQDDRGRPALRRPVAVVVDGLAGLGDRRRQAGREELPAVVEAPAQDEGLRQPGAAAQLARLPLGHRPRPPSGRPRISASSSSSATSSTDHSPFCAGRTSCGVSGGHHAFRKRVRDLPAVEQFGEHRRRFGAGAVGLDALRLAARPDLDGGPWPGRRRRACAAGPARSAGCPRPGRSSKTSSTK